MSRHQVYVALERKPQNGKSSQWLKQLLLKPGDRRRVSHVGAKTQAPKPSSAAFLCILVGGEGFGLEMEQLDFLNHRWWLNVAVPP